MANLAVLAAHFERQLGRTPLPPGERWTVIHPLGGEPGHRCFRDSAGDFWRLIILCGRGRRA